MKKALSVILALAVVISCLSMITVFAEDSVYGKNLLSEAESTFTDQTAVPAAWKGLDSTLSIETDPQNPDNKVLKGTTSETWRTPYIEVGKLIKTAMEGAGLKEAAVKFSMRVYAQAAENTADADNTVARMILRDTKDASFCNETINKYTMFGGNDKAGKKFNEWYTVEGILTINEADLATINASENSENSWRLCLDSIGSSAAAVLMDDVAITFEQYDGVQITVTEDDKAAFIVGEGTKGFITEVDGDIAIAKIILSNESAADIYARLQPSVRHEGSSASWEALATGEYQLVPAGKSVELTVKVPVKKNITAGGTTEEYSYSDAFIKIDVTTKAEGGAPLPKDTILYVSGNDLASKITSSIGYTAKAVQKADLPESVNNLYTGEEDGGTNEEPVFAEVVNGNAEDGTTGWGIFLQGKGTVEQVAGGANGTAHAIKFTPSGDKAEYESIAFDLGAAIVDDPENGYNGAGAGEYTIKFWAKGEKAGKFEVLLNSQEHQGAAPDEGRPVSSWLVAGTMEMTDQWKQYEVKLTVTEDYLKSVKALYASGKTNAYQLILRLDGSSTGQGKAFAESTFAYYVDEVTIEAPNKGGAEETDEVQGVTVKVTSADEGAGVYVKFDQFAGHLENGKMTVKIHNTGTSEIKLVLEARLNDSKWTTVKAGEAVTIAAGKVATLTIDCPDKMTSPVDSKEYVPFMLLKIDGAKAGDQFTVYGFTRETMETQKPVSTITTGKASLEYGTTTKACPTGDAAPVAILAIAAAACVMLGLVVAAKKKKETVG